MKYSTLGNTDVKVSRICLGTMTYGQQNTEKEAHQQLDYAVANGVNFIDTAEMYAVPATKETYGLTEKYIGTWLNKRTDRHKLVIASKVAGRNPDLSHIRGGPLFTADQIEKALEGSLQRLQTDYIDLYQLHWPERKTNFFKDLGYKHDPDDDWEDNFLEILTLMQQFIKEGKIRFVGVSNETPWGVMRFLMLAEKHNLPRIVSIQNPYSLINRTFEVGLAEMAIREKVGLLAYSPLGAGMLTGKYFQQPPPSNARLTLFPQFKRYSDPLAIDATRKYVKLAEANGLTPSQMALAFVNSRDFLTSNIIGATSMGQLKENIDTVNIDLSEDLSDDIDKIHLAQPNPAP